MEAAELVVTADSARMAEEGLLKNVMFKKDPKALPKNDSKYAPHFPFSRPGA